MPPIRTILLVSILVILFGGLVVSAQDTQHARGEPQPLVTIMRDMSTHMEQIQQGLWYENFDLIQSAARSIAEHPPVTDAERSRIQAILGEDFPRFVAGDKNTHDLAAALAEIAGERDISRAVAGNGRLQQSCVSCHNDFRQRLRSGE